EPLHLDQFKQPTAASIGKKELQMAEALIDSMSVEWEPEQYVDDYRVALEKVIEQKVGHGGTEELKPVKKPKTTNVIDLVSVLQESLNQTGRGGKKKPAHKHPR